MKKHLNRIKDSMFNIESVKHLGPFGVIQSVLNKTPLDLLEEYACQCRARPTSNTCTSVPYGVDCRLDRINVEASQYVKG